MKVVILGAGIGGLTVAHKLATATSSAQSSPIEIHVYEKLPVPGGQARSEGARENTREISWRVYFQFYRNLFQILSEIPSGDNDGRSVIDHLVPYSNTTLPPWNFRQLATAAHDIFRATTASERRLLQLDKYTWHDKSNTQFNIPQWLGLDQFKASYASVARIGVEQHILGGHLRGDYVFDGPTNEVWFEPWIEHLKNLGVYFHFSTPVTQIKLKNNGFQEDLESTQLEVQLQDGEIAEADIYVLALPVHALAALVPEELIPHADTLAERSYQIQLAFQLYLDQPWSFGHNDHAQPIQSVLLSETPWALIIEAKYVAWQSFPAPWSVTVCQADVPGVLYKKPFATCTLNQAYEEILQQLTSNTSFCSFLRQHNPTFEKIHVTRWNTMTDTFTFPDDDSYRTNFEDSTSADVLTTTEPKFSNNAGTKALRPSYQLRRNIFIATAYVQETIDVFSMEAAAIGGCFVAATILQEPRDLPRLPTRPLSWLLGPIRIVDDALIRLGLFPASTFILLLLVLFVVAPSIVK